jgi:hypothetical protein
VGLVTASPEVVAIDARAVLADLFGRERDRDIANGVLAGLATSPSDLADRLVELAGSDADRRADFTDAIGRAAARLAPDGEAPRSGAEAEAWRALVGAAARLHGFGAAALGRLPFVSDRLLEVLAAEARAGLPRSPGARRAVVPSGRMLTNVARSRKLRDAVSAALEIAVAPTGNAVYEYDPPRSHVATHVDSRSYELVVHLVIEHGGPGVSELVVHRPDALEPDRVALRAGEGVALRGRGTIHSWRPLGDDEDRLLAAIGFVSG